MLGRDRRRRPRGTASPASPRRTSAADGRPVLRAERPDQPAPARTTSRSTCAPGEVVGLGGLLGVRPQRDRQGDRRRAAAGRAARSRSTAGACAGARRRPRDPGRHRRCSPRTARPRASSRTCPSGRTSCSPRCPGCPGSASSPSAGRTGSSTTFMRPAADQGVQPATRRSASCPAATSRRCCSPGWLCHEPEGAAARRADPRHRRRRQGRGPGADRRAGRRGPRRGADLLRPGGARRGRRPGRRAARRRRRRRAARRRGRPSASDPMARDRGDGGPDRPTHRGRPVDAAAGRSAWLQDVRRLRGDRRARGCSTSLFTAELPARRRTCALQLVQVAPGRASSRSAWPWSSAPRASTCRSAR